MNPWLQWLGSAAVAGVLVTVINGLFSKRKLSAEATDIIAKAASGVVERLEEENARVIASNVQLQGKVEAGTVEQQLQREHLRSIDQSVAQHVLWDQQIREILRDNGIDVPEPPQLPGPLS